MHHYCTMLLVVLGITVIDAMGGDALRAAYESVVVSNLEASAVRKGFDLDHADVSQFMLARMNAFSRKGDGPCAEEVMGSLLHADPGKGIEWLLDRYGQLSAVGRANMAKSLRHSDAKEAYELLSVLLADKETAVNEHAAAVAPISPTRPFVHLRVCDYAFNSLVQTLGKDENLPADLPRRLSWDVPTEDRDQAIKRFADWWTQESLRVLSQKPSVTATRPSVQEKLRALEKKPR